MQILKDFFPFFANVFLDIRRLTTGSYGEKNSGEFNHRMQCLILRWERICALTSTSAMFDVIPSVFQLLLGITVKVYKFDVSSSQFVLRDQNELALPDRSQVFGGSPVVTTLEVLFLPADDVSSSRFLPLLPLTQSKVRFLGGGILDEVLAWDKFVKAQYNVIRIISWGITSRPLGFTSKNSPAEDDYYNLDLKSSWDIERWVEEISEDDDSFIEEEAENGTLESSSNDSEGDNGNSGEEDGSIGFDDSSGCTEKEVGSPIRADPCRGKALMVKQLGYNPFNGESPPSKKQKLVSAQSPTVPASPVSELSLSFSSSGEAILLCSEETCHADVNSPTVEQTSSFQETALSPLDSPVLEHVIPSSNSLCYDHEVAKVIPYSDKPVIVHVTAGGSSGVTILALLSNTSDTPAVDLPNVSSPSKVFCDLVEDDPKNLELEISPKTVLSLVLEGEGQETSFGRVTAMDAPIADIASNVIDANQFFEPLSSNTIVEDYSKFLY